MRGRFAIAVFSVCAVAAPAHAAPQKDSGFVQVVRDPGTGLDVVLRLAGPADASLEIADKAVTVKKQLVNGADITTLTTSKERLTVTLTGRKIVVSGTAGAVTGTPERPGSLEAARSLLSRSDAVKQAIGLLGRVNLGPLSPVGHAFVVTRSMLLAEVGDPRAAQEMERWVRNARQAITLRPVSLDNGPGDCWAEYSKEAIAAYMEYEACMNGCKWYDIFDELLCATIYDMRAIGAFSWWLHCVALR